jgi:serine/threonine protein kinase
MDVSDYPDFSSHGYQVTRELGRNREAGRITYLATAQNLEQQVVIKEFRFAVADANWSGFKAYQREIEMLQQLEHPRIPRYLDSFETKVGFCLVQEYKNAPSLVERRSFNPEDIKQIAVSVLEILVYLQRRVPPIIHRDIKPENILVDKQLNAYLVDFGFARWISGC